MAAQMSAPMYFSDLPIRANLEKFIKDVENWLKYSEDKNNEISTIVKRVNRLIQKHRFAAFDSLEIEEYIKIVIETRKLNQTHFTPILDILTFPKEIVSEMVKHLNYYSLRAKIQILSLSEKDKFRPPLLDVIELIEGFINPMKKSLKNAIMPNGEFIDEDAAANNPAADNAENGDNEDEEDDTFIESITDPESIFDTIGGYYALREMVRTVFPWNHKFTLPTVIKRI